MSPSKLLSLSSCLGGPVPSMLVFFAVASFTPGPSAIAGGRLDRGSSSSSPAVGLSLSGEFGIVVGPKGSYLYRDIGVGNTTESAILTSGTGGLNGADAAISGDLGLIGGYTLGGKVYLFRNLGTLTGTINPDAILVATNPNVSYFGDGLALSGNTALVGGERGQQVYVYHGLDTATGTISESAILEPSRKTSNVSFTSAISMDGNTALVGASGWAAQWTSGNGGAYLFRDVHTASGIVTESAILAAPGAAGAVGSVSLSGNIGLVGQTQLPDFYDGMVYVYRNLDTATGIVANDAQLLASRTFFYSNFGDQIAQSGNTALVGASSDDIFTGAVYLYHNLDVGTGSRTEDVRISSSTATPGTNFGLSLALDGDRFLIGSTADVYYGRISAFSAFDSGNQTENIEGLSFQSKLDWTVGNHTSGNRLILGAGNTADITATGKHVYIGKETDANDNMLVLSGTLIANTVHVGATGNAGNTLTISGNGDLQTSGGIVNNGLIVLDFAADRLFASSVSGTGQFVKKGGGLLTLEGDIAGQATIEEGTLRVGNGQNVGWIAGNILNQGTLKFERNDAMTYHSIISGTGGVLQSGVGTLTFTAEQTFTGAMHIERGTLQLGDGGTGGSVTGDIVNQSALIFNRSSDWTYGGTVSGTGSMTKAGSNTLTLTGQHTHSGGTTVSAGILSLTGSARLGTGLASVAAGATLRLKDDLSFGATPIANEGALLLEDRSKFGTGTVTNHGDFYISHHASGGGATFSNFARLYFQDFATAGSVSLTNHASGTLYFRGNTSAGDSTIINQHQVFFEGNSSADFAVISNALTGAIVFRDDSEAGTAILINQGSSLLEGNSSAANANFTNRSTGTLTFRGTAKAGQSQIANQGAIHLEETASLDAATVTNSGNLTLSGNATAGDAIITNQALISLTGNASAGSASLTNSGTGSIQFQGTASAAQAAIVNSVNSSIDISGLQAEGTGIGSLSGSGNVILGAKTLTFGQSGGNDAFAGRFSGSGGLVKTGTGSLTLMGSSDYTGITVVESGLLRLANSADIASSALAAIRLGATLAGIGKVGSLQVEAGGIVAPGESPGVLTVDGDANFLEGSVLSITLSNAGGVAGGGWSLLEISGAATFNGAFTLSLTLDSTAIAGFNPQENYLFRILSADFISGFHDPSLVTFDLSRLGGAYGTTANWSLMLNESGNGLDLSYDAVPEPSVWAMLLGAIFAAAAFRRCLHKSDDARVFGC